PRLANVGLWSSNEKAHTADEPLLFMKRGVGSEVRRSTPLHFLAPANLGRKIAGMNDRATKPMDHQQATLNAWLGTLTVSAVWLRIRTRTVAPNAPPTC